MSYYTQTAWRNQGEDFDRPLFRVYVFKDQPQTDEMAERVKVFANESDELSLIPGTHGPKAENPLCPLASFGTYTRQISKSIIKMKIIKLF